MKKLTILALCFAGLLFSAETHAQKYVTKNGHIKFYSETPIETIEAHNYQVNSAINIETGDFVFKVLMKSFEFEKALMQEHFNENYVESDTYPNSTFVGKIDNLDQIVFTKEGRYEATVSGDLTLHGVTNPITEKGIFTVEEGQITGNSTFMIKPADYDIKIPMAVVNNIAEEIEVTVNVNMKELKK